MPRLLFVSLVVLIAFWTAIAVITATTFALALRPGERAAIPIETPAHQPTPTPVPEPERPERVPARARLITGALASGDDTPPPGAPFAEQDIFYALNCRDGLLTVATSKEIVYAVLDCGEYWLADDVVRPFLAQPVRVLVVPGDPTRLSFESATGLVARFLPQAVWIEEL